MATRARDALVLETLAAADVPALSGRSYQALSGGEQQRVQFARALAQLKAGSSVERRQLLFHSEPVSNLDLRHQLALLDAAHTLAQRGTAVVAVLHDINLALAYADHLIVMREGAIAAQGAPDEIVRDELLADVFGVSIRLGAIPPAGVPFLLPQTHNRSLEQKPI